MDERYTLSIKVALPGTPLMKEDGTPQMKDDKEKTSAAGHVWYSISDGKTSNCYGFAPDESNLVSTFGPGKVDIKDDSMYHNPYYIRTIEITKEQYEQLKNYGETAREETNPDFSTYYGGLRNSCVDFTWKALNSAGIKHDESSKYEGSFKPKSNIDNIKSIQAPFPESELNKEINNEKPSQTWMQRQLTQNEEQNSFNEESLEDLIAKELNISKGELHELANSKELKQEVTNAYNEQVALQNKNEQINSDSNDHIVMHRCS